MQLIDGTKVLATPSILYREGYAVVAVNGGEGGYLYVREEGTSLDPLGERWQYVYRVFDDSMDMLGEGDDIYSGVIQGADRRGEVRILEAVGSLISFLQACVEARDEDSENYDLFEPEVRDWADMNEDNLGMIALEIEAERGE